MKHGIIILLVVTAIVLTSCTNSTEGSHDEKGPYKFGIYDIEDSTLTIIKDFGTIEESVRPQFALYRPDGNRIVYYMRKCLYAIDIDGGNEMKISGDLDVDEDFPFAAEDGVYFAAYNGDKRDIYRTEWYGSAYENITGSEEIDEHQPFLNTNSTMLLYISIMDTTEVVTEHNLSEGVKKTIYTSYDFELYYPGYCPEGSEVLFFYGDNLSTFHEDSDSLLIFARNPNPPMNGQLTFNTKYNCLFFTSGYLYMLDLESVSSSEVNHSVRDAHYPATSLDGDWVSVYSWVKNSVFILNIDNPDDPIEIRYGYYSRFGNDSNFLAVLIHD